jgi:hypothetical protein
MAQLYDWNWSVEERNERQYNHFVLLGGKGFVLAYPTVKLSQPANLYTKEEAVLNATVASHAPQLLRALENIAMEMSLLADEDIIVRSWRNTLLSAVAVAKGEATD